MGAVIRARIDLRQQIAGVHQLALREGDLGDRSCNLTMDRDGVVGLHCAYAPERNSLLTDDLAAL